MRVTLGPIASSTGLTRSKAFSVAADHDRGVAGLHRYRGAGQGAVQHDRAGLFLNSAATARLSSGSIVLMSM